MDSESTTTWADSWFQEDFAGTDIHAASFDVPEHRVQARADKIASKIAARPGAESELQLLNRSLHTILKCNEILMRMPNETELLNEICRVVVEVAHHRMAWVGFAEKNAQKSVRVAACFGADDGYLDHPEISWSDGVGGQGPSGTAIRTGLVQVVKDLAQDRRIEPWRCDALQRGHRSSISLPLLDQARAFGVLTIYSGDVDTFDAQEVELLTDLASDLSYGIRAQWIRNERDQALRDLGLSAKVFEISRDGILITDVDRNILTVNHRFTEITGYSREEALGQNPRLITSNHYDANFRKELWATIRSQDLWTGEIFNRRKNGEIFPTYQSIYTIRDTRGDIIHYIGVITDITERKANEARIRHLTQYDELTGLANRNWVSERLGQVIDLAQRSHRDVAVILLDLDQFKLVNDSLGHSVGDDLLKVVASRLSDFIRPGDVAARVSGDKFMVVMANVESDTDAALMARSVLQVIASPMRHGDHQIVLTACIGVALYPKDGELSATLIENADAAMYRAKELGRHGIQFYAPELNARMRERLDLEAGLRRAIKNSEFVLYYQPQVDAQTKQIIGAEALIRWNHPVRGIVSPNEFIGLAEETGLIVPIGAWVIETACQQLRDWHVQGHSDLCIAVNLSASQFIQDDLLTLVRESLRANGLSPHHLELEITESAMMQDPQKATEILRNLKKIGVRIALDDFGTGYSSLNYLKHFPIDVVKIDQSFVRDLVSDPDDLAITQAVIAMSHGLGHVVIAEGVESQAQFEVLLRNGCDLIQGFLFSRPVPPEQFIVQLY